MKLNKKEEIELNELIREGIAHLNASETNIKYYLNGVSVWFQRLYDGAKEEANWPVLLLALDIDDNHDYKRKLEACIRLLQDIRSNIETKKQVKAARCANVISIIALAAAIIIPSILTTQCSNKVKFDENQLENFELILEADSTILSSSSNYILSLERDTVSVTK